MDVHTYDIPAALTAMKNTSIEGSIPMIKFLFGETATEQKAASPTFFVDRAGKLPFLVISAGVKDGAAQNVSNINSEAFTATLKRNGHDATHVHFASRSHVSLVLEFGKDGDGVTAAVKNFLDRMKTSSTGRFPLLRLFAKLWSREGSLG